jgi:Xaa-Pro aminopeptidase
LIEQRLQAGKPTNEYEVQSFILEKIAAGDCMSDAAPIVAVNANASNPHYAPTAQRHSRIKKGDVILIDLWAKKKTPGAVFADITWMGYAGANVPTRVQEVFNVVAGARDTGVRFIRENFGGEPALQGFRVDETVRRYITDAGFGKYFFHRTGHSLGVLTHDVGVNIDSYETRDTRAITPGVAFSIEPGIYLEEFGVRSEINVYMGEHGPEIHTPAQQELIKLAV